MELISSGASWVWNFQLITSASGAGAGVAGVVGVAGVAGVAGVVGVAGVAGVVGVAGVAGLAGAAGAAGAASWAQAASIVDNTRTRTSPMLQSNVSFLFFNFNLQNNINCNLYSQGTIIFKNYHPLSSLLCEIHLEVATIGTSNTAGGKYASVNV